MKEALIGHTGFVGGTLDRTQPWAARYNSRNIETIAGRIFDRVVCAGTSAVKWRAQQDPEQDMAQISRLMAALDQVMVRYFVLISTVDVYHPPAGVTEATVASEARLHAYGRNRLVLERFVAARFERHLIVRLPALFGVGLKKNVLFDLMNDHRCELVDPAAVYQWYPLARLPHDLAALGKTAVSIVNLVTEPVATMEILHRCFSDVRVGVASASPVRYDVQTVHAKLLGGHGAYIMDAPAVLHEIEQFIAAASPR